MVNVIDSILDQHARIEILLIGRPNVNHLSASFIVIAAMSSFFDAIQRNIITEPSPPRLLTWGFQLPKIIQLPPIPALACETIVAIIDGCSSSKYAIEDRAENGTTRHYDCDGQF